MIALDIVGNILVPALHQRAGKHLRITHAPRALTSAIWSARDTLSGDVGKLNFGDDVFTAIPLPGDSLRLGADRFFDFGEHLPVVRQRRAQRLFRLPNCGRQIINFQRHDCLRMNLIAPRI